MSKKQKKNQRKWSQQITDTSRALILEKGVFTWNDPKKIAKSLKKSALKSTTRKGSPFQSAMSMLNFYINRAGKNIDPNQKKFLKNQKLNFENYFNLKYKFT